MKSHYIALVAAALAIAACAKTVEQPEPEGAQLTIRAYQEGAAEQYAADQCATETKTTVQDGGTQVLWEPSDEIKVFFRGTGGRFISQNTQNDAVAEFSGTLNVLVGLNEGASGSNDLWGLYPYRSDATSDGNSVTTTLPAEQTGRPGSFAKNTHITLARSSSHDLAFYNVCGGVRFSLTQEGIKSVTFEGNNGETLAGILKLTFDGGVPAIQEVTGGEPVLTLNAPGGSFETGRWYYLEAIPVTLSGGFKMVFHKDGESAKLSSGSAVSIKRGKYGSLADADENLLFKENGGGETDPGSVIQFVDPIAKYACVEKFDTDGDGEVSYAEAAAATSLSGLFKDWNTVTSFEEIKYFTGVTSTEGVFNGMTKLESITIPDFITTLGTFQGCSSLKSAVLPSGLKSLPSYCFSGCSALTGIDIPSGITGIPQYCFNGCSALAGVEIPAGVKTIGNNAFSGCTALTTVILPSDLTTIPSNCFQNCSSLASINWPANLKTISGGAFGGCRFEKANFTLELPASVTTIGSSAFGYLHHIVIPSTTAVSIQSNSFTVGYTNLYVPAGMVEMYKVRTNWSNYADHIFPIGDYPREPPVSGIAANAVDLGLPSGLKWASWNLGASSPEEYGAYFAWGEIEPKWDYNWSTYKFELGTGYQGPFSKYVTNSNFGTVDNKTVLDPEDDAAHVNWGGSWRMPTLSEQQELLDNCTWTWTTQNGVNGRLVTSNTNGNSIFLPAAGGRNGTSLYDVGSNGFYRSSSLSTDYPGTACFVYFYSVNVYRSNHLRYYGFSVRPVSE